MNNILSLKNKSKYFSLVFASLMLSLSLLSSFLSNLLPFFIAPFLKIDIGISFIFLAFIVSNWKYGLTILLANFLIHPLLPGTDIGFIQIFYIGKLIYIITCLIFVSLGLLIYTRIKNNKLLLSLFISSIITTIIITLLNGLLFTPIFLNIISNGTYSHNFIELMKQYTETNLNLIFIMPNYWSGIIFIYGLFNIISLTLNSLLFSILIKKTKINKRNKGTDINY